MWKFALRGVKGDKGDTGEQGEQGIQGEQGEQGVPGDFNYTDRGYLPYPDFDFDDFEDNSAWLPLDISSIVGVGHRLVLLGVEIESTDDSDLFMFRTHGIGDDFNAAKIATQAGGVEMLGDLWVWTDATGVIDYWLQTAEWVKVVVSIRGWVEPTS